MRLHTLKGAPGSRKKPVRVGRGIGSGVGKTSGRGQKGQKARAGGGVRRGFEGGQMPLYRRIPKRGFRNPGQKELATVNVRELNCFPPGTVVTPVLLREKKIVKGLGDEVKILGAGELKSALTVKAHRFSKEARAKIEAAGGKAEVI